LPFCTGSRLDAGYSDCLKKGSIVENSQGTADFEVGGISWDLHVTATLLFVE